MFTVITTDSRMLLCFYDEQLARQWSEHATSQLNKQLDAATPPAFFNGRPALRT
jgi:hypothetical protein